MVEVLEGQHQRLVELFGQVSSPDADRPAVLHDLLAEMAAHVAAERATVAPVVKERGIGGDLADRLGDDYERIEKLMVLIERRKFNSPDVPDLVTELKDVAEAHVERCRADLAPGLSELAVDEQLELGEKVANEDDMVVTHPHPHLLSLGPLASKLTGVASRFDSLRDRTVNVRHPEGAPDDGGAGGPGGDGSSGPNHDPSMGGAT